MLVYYFIPFIVSNRYLLFWVSNGHNSVTVQNRTHVYMNFFHHKDLGNHLLQLCPKVVKHPVYKRFHQNSSVGNYAHTLFFKSHFNKQWPSSVPFTCGPLALQIFRIKICMDFSYVLPRACYVIIEGKQLNRTTWWTSEARYSYSYAASPILISTP